MKFTAEDVRAFREKHQCGTIEAKAALQKAEIATRLDNLMLTARGDLRELVDIIREMNR